MQVITGTREFQIEEPTAVTIGKFDGRHKGHQKLLREMLCFKERQGLKAAVFTFDMAPAGVMAGRVQTVITTNQERRNKMAKMGIDYLVEYPFDQNTAHMSPEEFVSEVLVRRMHAKAVVVGTDCSFGYKGKGNAQLLKEMSESCGFEAVIIEKEQDDHRDISSTYVREELDQGNIEKANELLGEPYAIHGVVVHGNHIGGAILGFPTANILPPPEKHLPPFGVYVSQVLVDGALYRGVTNIGKKPTVEGESPVGVETFIMGLEANLYGKEIEVQLLNFERPEQKFSSLEELKERIEKDKEYAAAYFDGLSR
ncbi:MAG: bifunctional riboflavin kinase/FAD synthetase [Monoglobales bacterium]|jgi:riboflavin kinase/FMN adenylyltransferase